MAETPDNEEQRQKDFALATLGNVRTIYNTAVELMIGRLSGGADIDPDEVSKIVMLSMELTHQVRLYNGGK